MKRKPARRPPAALALALAAALLGACGGGEPPAPGPVYSGVLGASEFTTGANRFPFGLVDRDGAFLEGAEVSARFSKLDGDESRFHSEAPAQWRVMEEEAAPHSHAGGEMHLRLAYRGFYAVDEAAFPEPGVWTAEFAVADGTPTRRSVFEVTAEGRAPAVAERAPRTANRTIRDVASFAELSTRAVERDDLHNASVAESLDAGKPFVVFFASPRFCVSALCGPVTDTLARAREELGGAVEFIHIEPWDLDAARNEGRRVPSPEMAEWGLETEPWTFIVGADGRIAARFEGPVSMAEAVAAVRAAQARA